MNRTARLAMTALALTLAAATLAPGAALAADAPSPEDRARAADWYKLALSAMEREAFAEAALAFDAAHRLDPDPRLLFNAARAYQRSGNLESARERYNQFLIFKDADGELRKRALEEVVTVELELRGREDEASSDAEAAELRARLEAETRAREEAEARAAMEARLRELETERARLAAGASDGAPQEPRFERPEGKVPIRVFTNLSSSYSVTVRDKEGTVHKCPKSVINHRDCRLYIAPGPYRIQSRGGLDLDETFIATRSGSTVNLRESPTGLIVGTAVSWGALGAGVGLVALAFKVVDDSGAAIGMGVGGFLMALYGIVGGPLFTILLASEDTYTVLNRADDFDPSTQESAAARLRWQPHLKWTGVDIAPLRGGGGVIGTGFTF